MLDKNDTKYDVHISLITAIEQRKKAEAFTLL